MKSQYIFPIILMSCDVGAAIIDAVQGDIKKAIYWVAAAILTATVTF